MRRFLLVVSGYVLAAIALVLAHVPHAPLLLLVLQHAAVLPCVVLALQRTRGPLARDIDVRLLAIVAAATALAVIAIAAYWDRGMLWGDEMAYRAQANMFASGRLWAHAPWPTSGDAARSAAELHFNHMVIHDGHWFAKYPPLWPLVLAAGVLVHVRWLVDPLLAVGALWILARLARELGVPARFTVLLAVASPYFYMMAASQMSHVLGLACCAGAALALVRGARTQRVGGFALAAALVAACCLVRPFTALCAGLALAPFYLRHRVRGAVPAAVVLGAVAVAAVALYDWLYTGHAALSPYALYRGRAVPVELSLAPHVILSNLAHGARWAVEDTMIFTWPLLFVLAGYALHADRRWPYRMLATFWIVFVVAELFMTEGSSSRFGDRYLFEACFAPLVLAARGAQLVIERWRVSRRALGWAAGALTVAGAVQGALLVRPTLREIAPYVRVHALVDQLPRDGSLVFFPVSDDFTGDRFDLNAAGWRASPHLFLVDPGPARRDAVAAAEHRASWIVIGARDGQAAILARSRLREASR